MPGGAHPRAHTQLRRLEGSVPEDRSGGQKIRGRAAACRQGQQRRLRANPPFILPYPLQSDTYSALMVAPPASRPGPIVFSPSVADRGENQEHQIEERGQRRFLKRNIPM